MSTQGWRLVADRQSMSPNVFSVAIINDFAKKRFPLKTGGTIVGRDAKYSEVVLPALHVSRQHAELLVDGKSDAVTIKDLGSANGTFVNGERVTQAQLRPGDQITFDTISLTLYGPGQDPDETVFQARAVESRLEQTTVRGVVGSASQPIGGQVAAKQAGGVLSNDHQDELEAGLFGVLPLAHARVIGGAVTALLLVMLGLVFALS